MSKLVIFCDNYTHVFPALRLASDKLYDQITIVITQYDSLFQFFQAINEKVFHNAINLVYPESYKPRMAKAKGLNKIWYVLVDIVQQRRHLNAIVDRYFAGLEGCDVTFGPGYNSLQIVLLKKLARKNNVIYYSPSPASLMTKYTPANISEWLTLVIYKLTWGKVVSMGQVPQSPYLKAFPYLPDKVITNEVDKIVDWDEANEMMKGFDLSPFKVFDVSKHKIIYFHDDFIEAPYSGVDKDATNAELTKLFGVLTKHFRQNEIATKFTPASAPKPRPQVGDILPAFVPGELYYSDNVKMYLSIASSCIANVETGLAVSMVDLVVYKNEAIREQLREGILQRSKSKILFPKSLDEFEQIVIDLKQHESLPSH